MGVIDARRDEADRREEARRDKEARRDEAAERRDEAVERREEARGGTGFFFVFDARERVLCLDLARFCEGAAGGGARCTGGDGGCDMFAAESCASVLTSSITGGAVVAGTATESTAPGALASASKDGSPDGSSSASDSSASCSSASCSSASCLLASAGVSERSDVAGGGGLTWVVVILSVVEAEADELASSLSPSSPLDTLVGDLNDDARRSA